MVGANAQSPGELVLPNIAGAFDGSTGHPLPTKTEALHTDFLQQRIEGEKANDFKP